MKSALVAFINSIALLLLATLLNSAHADELESLIIGKWHTPNKDGIIQITQQDNKNYSGTIIGGKGDPKRKDNLNPDTALKERLLVGTTILQNLHYAGQGKWHEGTIYDPNNGKTYSCRVELKDSQTLQIRGFIGVSLFGRTDTWTRISE